MYTKFINNVICLTEVVFTFYSNKDCDTQIYIFLIGLIQILLIFILHYSPSTNIPF